MSKKIKMRNLSTVVLVLSVFIMASTLFMVPTNTISAWGADPGDGCCGGGDFGGDDFGGDDFGGDDFGGGYTPPTPAPTCTISATPSSVNYNGSTTLKWTTTNATGASIDGIGYVSVGANKSKVVRGLKANKTYTMTVTGAGGTSTCKVTVTVKPKPSCTLTVSPNSVSYGGNATLSWTTKNTSSASISGIGNVGLSGSYTVSNLTSNKTYTMTVSGNGQTSTCSASVTVNNPAPSCSITANPSTVDYDGSTTLTWTVQNAVSSSLDNGVGQVALNGSLLVRHLKSSKTYTLTVTGNGNRTATCSVNVSVRQAEASSCTLRFDPSVIDEGEDSTLIWTTENADEVYIDHGIGSVSEDGQMKIYDIYGTKYYTLTAKGIGGETKCHARVKVREEDLSCHIYANPNPDNSGTTTLHWESEGASWAMINNGVGTVPTDGSKLISGLENGTKVYTLTVGKSHSGGRTRTCSVTVRTNKTVTPPAPTYPTCDITATPAVVSAGSAVTLTWTSSNATSAIFQDNGAVATSGTRVVYPNYSGYYKLIVTNAQGYQSTCQTYVTVNSAPVVTVSSVPYTGPEDGIYVGVMGIISLISFAVLYRRRHGLRAILNI